MLKFIYVILMNLFRAPYMIPKMRHEADHPEKYSMEERYALCRHAIRLMKRTGGIHTKAYGTENLPAEGGYDFNNRNNVCNFKAGSFKIALKSKAPIVPVALIDSYRVFNSFWMGPVTTQVHYLKPIYFEEYGSLRTQEIANLVRDRIQEKIDEVLS